MKRINSSLTCRHTTIKHWKGLTVCLTPEFGISVEGLKQIEVFQKDYVKDDDSISSEKTIIKIPVTMRSITSAFCKQVDHPDPISQTFFH